MVPGNEAGIVSFKTGTEQRGIADQKAFRSSTRPFQTADLFLLRPAKCASIFARRTAANSQDHGSAEISMRSKWIISVQPVSQEIIFGLNGLLVYAFVFCLKLYFMHCSPCHIGTA